MPSNTPAPLSTDLPPDAPPLPPSAAAQHLRGWAVLLLVALAVLCIAWEMFLAPLRPGGSWWVLKVVPLLLPMAGMLRHRLYTYRWLSLLVWLYFTEGIVRATSETGTGAWLAWGETALSVLLFVVCTAYIRHRLRRGRTLHAEVAVQEQA